MRKAKYKKMALYIIKLFYSEYTLFINLLEQGIQKINTKVKTRRDYPIERLLK